MIEDGADRRCQATVADRPAFARPVVKASMDNPEPTGFDPIACERLDKDNAAWARQYVDKWQARLDAEGDDAELAAYARREIAAYQDLLQRFLVLVLVGLALPLALARPALALVQYGEHSISRPALLADRLRLAAEDIRQARAIGRSYCGRPLHLQADVPRWARDRLHAAERELWRASYDTVDPSEQSRITGFRARAEDLGRQLDRSRLTLWPSLSRLHQAVLLMADQVQARVARRVPDLAPLTRPPVAGP